ncbi:MAG: hypothetical protein ACJ8ER_12755 [Allosphingosinicella sp.]
MMKAAMTIAIVAALAGAPLRAAPPPSADEALARQQAGLHSTLGLDCERRRAEGEIIVCGRAGPDPNRLPLYQPDEGRHETGEPPEALDALALSKQRCTTVGPNQQCSGGLPVIAIAVWLAKTAIKAAKDEE